MSGVRAQLTPLNDPCSGYGEMMQGPSRFLAEVPTELVGEWQIGGEC